MLLGATMAISVAHGLSCVMCGSGPGTYNIKRSRWVFPCVKTVRVHGKATKQSSLFAVGLAIAVAMICFKIDLLWGFIALFPSLFILFGWAACFQDKFVENKGMTTKMNGAKQNEAVQDVVISGWSFTMPFA